MTKTVECADCGRTFLTFESIGPEPIDYDECPECGATEFQYVEEAD